MRASIPARAQHGEGFAKDLERQPTAQHAALHRVDGAAISPCRCQQDWAGTLRGDFYWQCDSFARIFNDRPYDHYMATPTINMALIFTNQDGWQAMAYVKNVLDTTASPARS